MNWKGVAAQYLTFVVAPLLGALGVFGALRWTAIDRLDARRFARWAVALFLVTRIGTQLVVFHLFRYEGTIDLLRWWEPMARAVLDGRNPWPFADNLSGPLFPFVLAAGLASSGGCYVPGINLSFVAADAIALWLLLRIARRHLPESTARRVVLAVLASPLLWLGVTACSQDEVVFACFLLAVLDLAETGRARGAVVVAALGTLCTKALFPLWALPVLVATSPSRGAAVRRVAAAGALAAGGIAAATLCGFDVALRAESSHVASGTTLWLLFREPGLLPAALYRAGVVATGAACVAAGLAAVRRRTGETTADRAARGVVAVQAAFFAVSPYSLGYHLAHGWPFLAWLVVREGAAERRLGAAAGALVAGFCVLQVVALSIGAEGIADCAPLLVAFTAFSVFAGWRALTSVSWH